MFSHTRVNGVPIFSPQSRRSRKRPHNM